MRRIGLAFSVTDRLSRIWSQRHLSLTTKFRLYSSCIVEVLLYACETWTLTKAHWKRLESFHLRCQRRILGIKWSDFITNAEVWTRSGLPSIQSMVRRHRLSLFGHVARRPMPDNVPDKTVQRVACDVRDGVPPFPNWRRLWGRPPITWLHQSCSDCGLSAGNALNCAQDRAVWRKYATASSALRWRRRRRCLQLIDNVTKYRGLPVSRYFETVYYHPAFPNTAYPYSEVLLEHGRNSRISVVGRKCHLRRLLCQKIDGSCLTSNNTAWPAKMETIVRPTAAYFHLEIYLCFFLFWIRNYYT